MVYLAVLSVSLIIGGAIAITRGSFRGGPDGESREYRGSAAKFWGYVWIVIGLLGIAGLTFDIGLLKNFIRLFVDG